MATEMGPLLHFDNLLVLLVTCWAGITFSATVNEHTQVGTGLATTCGTMPPEYSIQNLTTGNWYFAAQSKNCIGYGYQKNAKTNCTYTMHFCGIACDGASICVSTYNRTGKNDTVSYALGNQVDNYNPFSPNVESMVGSFTATYSEGGNYTRADNTTCSLSAVITFDCNRKVPWKPSKTGNSSVPTQPKLISFDEKKCQFTVTFDYEGACTSLIPASPVPEALSAGTVLIIIFFVSLTVYFALGIVINMIRGYRGKDVLPQSDFWITLPELIVDGCMFTCRCGAQENQAAYDSI